MKRNYHTLFGKHWFSIATCCVIINILPAQTVESYSLVHSALKMKNNYRKPRTKSPAALPITVQLSRSLAPPLQNFLRSRSETRKNSENRSVSRSRRDKCPLRIAELAEPSKRHCLNTWRDMPDTLPDYMVCMTD